MSRALAIAAVIAAHAAHAGASAIRYVQDEGAMKPTHPSINFTGDGVLCTDDNANNRTNCAISGGAASGYQTVQDEGSGVAQQTTINFIGPGVAAVNDGANSRTNVTISAAPTGATYITQTSDGTLSAEQALSGLSTGIVKVTTGTGVLSTAVAGDFPTLNQNTTGTAAALTADPTDCSAGQYATAISSNGNLTCAQVGASQLSGTVPVASGGTGVTASADDAFLVGNASGGFDLQTIPSCAAGWAQQWDTASNVWVCKQMAGLKVLASAKGFAARVNPLAPRCNAVRRVNCNP